MTLANTLTTKQVQDLSQAILDAAADWLPKDRPPTGGDIRQALGKALAQHGRMGGVMLVWWEPDGRVKINVGATPDTRRKGGRRNDER